jgi:hypothetical protein
MHAIKAEEKHHGNKRQYVGGGEEAKKKASAHRKAKPMKKRGVTENENEMAKIIS